jgi:hypothetical protein
MPCWIGVRSTHPVWTRRDRSQSGPAVESTERQSLEIGRQVAGATYQTGAAATWRAFAVSSQSTEWNATNGYRMALQIIAGRGNTA